MSAIMKLLNLTWVPVQQPLTLKMLGDAIANTTATAFWFYSRYGSPGNVDLSSRQPNSSFLTLSEVSVDEYILKFRLQLNALQLWASTVMALILLYLATLLTRGTDEATQINEVGFLQTLWLSQQHPEIKNLMSEIDNPSAGQLRERGMTTAVRLADQVKEGSTESTSLVSELFSNDSAS